ncbi:MAG: NTPase KAP [Burkholderiales bacterium]
MSDKREKDTMSLCATKTHLVQIITDPDNKVVALSGKWGTGKSHLWREVKAGSSDDKVKAALYVSLFGLSSMDQVKVKIVQSAIPSADQNPTWWDNAKKSWGAASKVLESFHKGFSALNEIALLAVPSILKDRVIALDDIERKHDKLSVDELMGFIDEFTQQHGARIILILNSDQLMDRKLWDTLREKVIDHEVRLDTSPAEAFEIASGHVSSPYADRVKGTVASCGITNIRVICKVIRAVNRILDKREDLSDDILARVIPSTVLLSAIHYKGIDDGPDFDFVLKVGNPDDWGDWGKKAEELDDAGKRRAKWRLQLQELGIHSCDEFEQLVVEYLKSGLFDVADVAKIIERYTSEADVMRTHNLAQQLHEHVIWHHRLTEAQLVAEAQSLAVSVHLLDAYSVTSLHELVSGLTDGAEVADSMVDNWIAEFHRRDIGVTNFENFLQRPIHPRIKAEFDTARAAAQAKTTVFEACKFPAQNNGWGHKQEAVMKSATVQDFEATIKSLEVDELRIFMCRFLEMCVQRPTYQPHFGPATDRFIEACRNICADASDGRLGSLIKLLFKSAKLEAELNPPRLAAAALPSTFPASTLNSAPETHVATPTTPGSTFLSNAGDGHDR